MESDGRIRVRAIKLRQPIGEFFLAAMDARDLILIAYADVRKLTDNELDQYMGINRRLSAGRVKELESYVETYDATFPTSVILAVSERNARFDRREGYLELFCHDGDIQRVAKIIDGQHRIAGLRNLSPDVSFDVGVAVFVGADIATQANIFATVNLAQTKVNRSLAYDLLDYEKAHSPQKSAHFIAVALDQIDGSPFFHRIKRLGRATEGRDGETITQAVVVEMLLSLISREPLKDRDRLYRKLRIVRPPIQELKKYPFRTLFMDGKEEDIAMILLRYFDAVRDRWPRSWEDVDRPGNTLPKTNGFRALMRFLRLAYLRAVEEQIGSVPDRSEFDRVFGRVQLEDKDFNSVTFPPGTSGEAGLYRYLRAAMEDSGQGAH